MSTKQAIIDTYLDLGLSLGYDNVSLNNIAGSVGIKKASIFSHFTDYNALKEAAVSYCMEKLASVNFEINPKAPDAESLFLDLVNSFIEVFCNMPGKALLILIDQKHYYDSSLAELSDKIDLMIESRFKVAFDFCIQRSWTELADTDNLAVLFSAYLRKLIVNQKVSDESLSDFIGMILSTL